jgi:hypothetical protein
MGIAALYPSYWVRHSRLYHLILRSLRSKRLEGCGPGYTYGGLSWFETALARLLTMRI